MTRKQVIWAVLAPFIVCLILAPLVFAPAQQKVAAMINQHTLKAAAELKRPQRLKTSSGMQKPPHE